MPKFLPGVSKTAIAPITVRPSGLSCSAELFLGPDDKTKKATSGKVAFTSAGAEQKVNLPLTMPLDEGGYHCYIDVFTDDMQIAAYQAVEDVIIAEPEPSQLLKDYQYALNEAYIAVEAGYPDGFVMVPGYGLQYASVAIPQLEGLMIEEAINIGMIGSANECYFVRDIMYFSDGTTIVPYWWNCPYCSEKFRSPDLRDAHINQYHWDIVNTKASITNCGVEYECLDPPWCDYWVPLRFTVTWRNDSPFPITGRVSIPRTTPIDTTVSPGQSVTVHPEPLYAGGYGMKVTLTLVGAPLPGMLLDTCSFDFHG